MAIALDVAGDRLTQATGYAFPTTGTLSVWVYPYAAQTDGNLHRYVFICDADYVPQFSLSKGADNALEAGWYDGSEHRIAVASAGYTLTQSAWNHFLVTWDDTANETRLYLNSTQVGSNLATLGTADLSAFQLYLGADPVTPGSFNCNANLAEVALWTRVLTGTERTGLFAGQAASSHATGLSRYWRLTDDTTLTDAVASAVLTNTGGANAGTHPTIINPVTGTAAMEISVPAMAATGTFAEGAAVTGTIAMTIGAPSMAATGTGNTGEAEEGSTVGVGRIQSSSVSGGGTPVHGSYVCNAVPAPTVVNCGYTPSAVIGWDVTAGDSLYLWSEGMPVDTCIAVSTGACSKISSAGITSTLNGFVIGVDASVQVAEHEFRFVAVR